MKKFICPIGIILIFFSVAGGQQILENTVISSGVTEEYLNHLDDFIESYIDQQLIPGSVFLIAGKGKTIYQKAVGNHSLENSATYPLDDLFRIAFREMQIADRFNEKVFSFSMRPIKKAITIRHLMIPTSGILYRGLDQKAMKIVYQKHSMTSAGLSYPDWTKEKPVNQFTKVPLAFEPGKPYAHNGETISVSGEAVQNMDYALASGKKHFAGDDGLLSSAEDYMIFLQVLLNNGRYKSKKILRKKTAELMASAQMTHLNRSGNGFSKLSGITYSTDFALLTEKSKIYGLKSPGTYEWSEFFNTRYFIEHEEELIFIGMTEV